MTRTIAASALGRIPDLPDDAVPCLIQALEDTSITTASEAARSLGIIGPRAKTAVPALLKFYPKQGGRPTAAAEALLSIAPETAAQHGIFPPGKVPPSLYE